MSIQGFEVPHVHIHLIPMYEIGDLDHTKAGSASSEKLSQIGKKIRDYITQHGLS